MYIYIYVCVHTYIYIYIYLYTYVYISTYIHIYMYICTHMCIKPWCDVLIVCSVPIRWLLFDTRSFKFNHLMRKMVDNNHTTWYGRFPKFHRVFFGPRPWHIEIRHRVKRTSTINLFGFETLKLKIRRLKLWKQTVDSAFRQEERLRRMPKVELHAHLSGSVSQAKLKDSVRYHLNTGSNKVIPLSHRSICVLTRPLTKPVSIALFTFC